jgi:hypothetical protein
VDFLLIVEKLPWPGDRSAYSAGRCCSDAPILPASNACLAIKNKIRRIQ